ncbi:unnamed protein product [Clonostachys byssicola]|uniref:Thiol methyltransferase 2 n=1 Tax=Clonostachys byssicola TaxID=160290 RepID=A0A9N9UQA9_9HYPO|nr:unnamed protein product [Clonostachys byssicola]
MASAPQLSELFGAIPVSQHPKQWDKCYKESLSPWDRKKPSLALADLLVQRPDLLPPAQELDPRGSPLRSSPTSPAESRSALVPACGFGWDALLLASFGYNVWALDVSSTAIEKAKEIEKESLEKDWYKTREHFDRGTITWITADFFDQDWAANTGVDGTGKFDLIFDYTFLCALPPQTRPQWSQRMAELLHHKGRLVCLEFPSGKPLSSGGPPWGLSPEVYEALLTCPGEPIEYDSNGSVSTPPSPKPRDNAIHRLSLSKPTRTHQAGTNEDGTVNDFISVWSF